MEAAADMHARHAATLAELSALGLELARKVQASAMATDDPKAEAALTGAFHKLSRSVRQTMALEAKLRREAQRTQPAPPKPPSPETREDRIRDEVSRLIWDEYEDDEDEAYALEDQLDDILDQDLPDIDEADIVAQIAEHLGLKDPPPQREGGDKRRLALGEPDAIENDLSIAARNARALGGSEAVEGVEAHQPLSPVCARSAREDSG